MKKTTFRILCTLCLILLAGACIFLYLDRQRSLKKTASLEQALHEQDKELDDLKNSLEEANDRVRDQKDYVQELTAQIDDMAVWAGDKQVGGAGSGQAPSYQEKYPELYAQATYDKLHTETAKAVYLTFDDGPSDLTPQVLDLLDEYNAKATFFVVYKEEKEYTKYLSEIVKRGHTLALHSYSHNYKKIYASVDAFLEDFQKVYDWVYDETGQRPALFRFPGGSTNGKRAIVDEIVEEMQRRGFIYYDWNVSSGDGSNLTTSDDIIENITTNVGSKEFPVVLMHDGPGKHATLRALPTVLKNLKDKGYSFESLDETMTPVQYKRK